MSRDTPVPLHLSSLSSPVLLPGTDARGESGLAACWIALTFVLSGSPSACVVVCIGSAVLELNGLLRWLKSRQVEIREDGVIYIPCLSHTASRIS
jgi:hypothetical protein